MIPFTLQSFVNKHAPDSDKTQLTSIHVNELPLKSQKVYSQSSKSNEQTKSTSPPDDRRSHQVVLDLSVSPTTHPQTEMEERPVKRFGGEDIFLVRVGNESVVGCHHRHIEMPEVAQERRSVELGIASRHCQYKRKLFRTINSQTRHRSTYVGRSNDSPRSSTCACLLDYSLCHS